MAIFFNFLLEQFKHLCETHSTNSKARWRNGYAADCKSVYTGSIPVRASIFQLTSYAGAHAWLPGTGPPSLRTLGTDLPTFFHF